MTESYESPFTKEVKECVCEKIGISKDKFDKGDYDKFPEATAGCILNIHEKNQKAKEKKETSFLDMQVNWTNTSIKTEMKEKRIDEIRGQMKEFAEYIYFAEEGVKILKEKYAVYVESIRSEFEELGTKTKNIS